MYEPDYKRTRAEVNSHMKQAQAHLNRDQKGECIREIMKTIDVLCSSNEEISRYITNYSSSDCVVVLANGRLGRNRR